jgi:hypothetical protein
MSREDIQKLLGGYATDTLSAAERSALFAAALEDQALFDALAKEQALRDVLQDPAARQQLITALGPPRETFGARAWQWLRRPSTLAMAGAMAAVLIVSGVALHRSLTAPRQEVKLAENLTPLPSVPLERQMTAPAAPPAKQRARMVAGKLDAPSPPPAMAPLLPPPAKALLSERAEAAAGTAVQEFRAQSAMPAMAMKRAKESSLPAGGLPVEYNLLREGADGAYLPVPADTVFQTGDSVRLQVIPSGSGRINLLQRDSTGGWSVVAAQIAETGHSYVLPSSGGLRSDKPSQLELMLVLSPNPRAFGRLSTRTTDAVQQKSAEQAPRMITLEFR